MKRALLLVSTLMCCGCGLVKPPAELDHDARVFMDLVRRDRLESALAGLRATAPPDTTIALLAQARDFLKPFPAESTTLIGWNVLFAGDDTSGSLTYEAHAHERTALLSVTVVRAGPKGSEIRAFHWQETAKPLAQLNVFTLSGKTTVHYVFLLLGIAAVVLCIGGAIFAGIQRMRVPWILFCLVGIGSASIDWSTGQQHYNPISFHLFGAGFVRRGDVAPWVVTWSLPLGTLLMLVAWRRRQRARRGAVELPDASSVVQ